MKLQEAQEILKRYLESDPLGPSSAGTEPVIGVFDEDASAFYFYVDDAEIAVSKKDGDVLPLPM